MVAWVEGYGGELSSGLGEITSTVRARGDQTMKAQHVRIARADALCQLQEINAHVGQDFHTLSAGQVENVLKLAKQYRYKKPRQANGSTARYYYQLLQRRAATKGAGQ